MGGSGDTGERGSVGSRVRRRRQELGLSQVDLAGSDLSPSYVSLVEGDRRVPSAGVVERLAERLQVSVKYLETGEEEDRDVQARADLAFLRMALDNGDSDAVIERGLALKESMGADWARQDEVDYLLACGYEASGNLEEACRLLEPIARRGREGTTEVPLAKSHLVLAGAYIEAGSASRAAEVADLGLAAVEKHGWSSDPEVARLAATAVWAYLERGDALYAAMQARDYLAQLPENAPLRSRAGLLWNEALARHALGQHRHAIALMERASALMSEADAGRDSTRGLMAQAWLQLRSPEPDVRAALGLLHQVQDQLTAQNAMIDLAECEAELARAHLLDGQPETALRLVESARGRLGPAQRAASAGLATLLAHIRLIIEPSADVTQLLDEAISHLRKVPPGRSTAQAWAELSYALEHTNVAQALTAARSALGAVGVHGRWLTRGANDPPVARPSQGARAG